MSPRPPTKASQLATALIEHSSDTIALVDEAGTVLYANPAASRLLGLPIADIIGANIFRWVLEDDIAAFKTNLARHFEQPGIPIKNEFRLRREDGCIRHLETIGVNRLDDPSICGIIINFHDVTGNRVTEEALRKGETRYRQLTEQASDMIYNCDLKGHFTYVNPTAVRLMKYSERELLGKHFLTLIRYDYRTRAREFYERQRREAIRSTYFEFPAVAKDGADVWVGQSVQIVEEDGKAIGIQAIARDITARLALEEQLRQAQKMEAIGRLAGGVAHDFNNVLTAILGCAELLSMQLDPKDPRRAEAEAIKRAADRGAGLTKRLLTLSRPQGAPTGVVDLVTVVQNMEPVLQRLMRDTIVIVVTATRPSIPILADESQVSQVLMNLVINARDAMPSGGTATIDLGIVDLREPIAPKLGLPCGCYAGMTVRDTGEGIPPEIQAQLFEPFFTTKPPEEGTGLGLSIVYGIVKSLKGTIEVQSEVGQGATFTVYLPIACPESRPQSSPQSAG